MAQFIPASTAVCLYINFVRSEQDRVEQVIFSSRTLLCEFKLHFAEIQFQMPAPNANKQCINVYKQESINKIC